TRQGDDDCWSHLAGKYCDKFDVILGFSVCRPESTVTFPAEVPSARWLIQTPNTRGAIVGRLTGLPASDWSARVTSENRSDPGLCGPVAFVVMDGGPPAAGAEVWQFTTYDQRIFPGKTDESGTLMATGLHA